jgi:hypothetical protein
MIIYIRGRPSLKSMGNLPPYMSNGNSICDGRSRSDGAKGFYPDKLFMNNRIMLLVYYELLLFLN